MTCARIRFFLFVTALCIVAGCGGGGSGRGRAVITVHWPDRSRVIPRNAQVIHIDIADAQLNIVGSADIDRTKGQSQATITELPTGTLMATVNALSSNRSLLASAAVSINISAGATT